MALVWAFLVRPEIRLTAESLTLRNALSRDEVPLQVVTGVEVREGDRERALGVMDVEAVVAVGKRQHRRRAGHHRGAESEACLSAVATSRSS